MSTPAGIGAPTIAALEGRHPKKKVKKGLNKEGKLATVLIMLVLHLPESAQVHHSLEVNAHLSTLCQGLLPSLCAVDDKTSQLMIAVELLRRC